MALTNKTLKQIEERYLKESRDISMERNDFLVSQIVDFIDEKRWFNLQPEYQRRNVWERKRKSLFIESLLLNLPVPPMFLYEPEINRYEVMDGQQRLNSLIDFVNNRFALTGLVKWSELNKLTYTNLPPSMRRGLMRQRISVVVLQPPLPDSAIDGDELRRIVFERLNTGGRALNAQEIRNCIYASPFSKLLVQLSASPDFNDALGMPRYEDHIVDGDISPELGEEKFFNRMEDCEFILRFFAFRRPKSTIRGSVKRVLDNTMEHYASASETELASLEEIFHSRLSFALNLFGADAFFLQPDEGKKRRSAPLFDAIMVACDQLYEHKTTLLRKRTTVRQFVPSWLGDDGTYEILVNKANTAESTKARLALFREALETCL